MKMNMSSFIKFCCIKDDNTYDSLNLSDPSGNVLPIINQTLNINIIETTDLCGICISPLQHKTTIMELENKCNHEFCQSCVVSLVKYNKKNNIILSCPLCRTT